VALHLPNGRRIPRPGEETGDEIEKLLLPTGKFVHS